MVRRFGRRFVYVLIAALLLAQQGVALHGLSHGLDALKVAMQGQSDPRAPQAADRLCDLCLTYAQLAVGAAPAPLPFAGSTPDVAPPLQSFTDTGTRLARVYQSRAPPRAV